MADEHGISWPDGGMCASDSGMSFYSCTKRDYHYLYKENDHLRARNAALEAKSESLRANCDAQQKSIEHLTRQLAAEQKSVDELSLHSQDLAHELAEARAEIARLRKAMSEIREGCSFPEDEVQKAVRDRITRELEASDESD